MERGHKVECMYNDHLGHVSLGRLVILVIVSEYRILYVYYINIIFSNSSVRHTCLRICSLLRPLFHRAKLMHCFVSSRSKSLVE